MTAHKTGRGGGAELGVYARLSESLPLWMDNAPCRSLPTATFFPTRGQDASEAKAVCIDCPHRVECAEFGISNHEFGIWGGTTESERRKLRRELRRERVDRAASGLAGAELPELVSPERAGLAEVWAARRAVRQMVRAEGWQSRDGQLHRVGRCGAYTLGAERVFRLEDGKARVAGVETCASTKLCPVCRRQAMTVRAAEVGAVVWRWLETPGHAAVLFTVSPVRRAGVPLAEAHGKVVDARRWVMKPDRGRWRRFREMFGVADVAWVIEHTWSPRTGWGPHVHGVLLVRRTWDENDAEAAARWLHADFAKALGAGIAELHPDHGVELTPADDPTVLGAYLAKFTVGIELADAGHKRGRLGGSIPAPSIPAVIASLTANAALSKDPEVRALVAAWSEFAKVARSSADHWFSGFAHARRLVPELAAPECSPGDRYRKAIEVLPVELRPGSESALIEDPAHSWDVEPEAVAVDGPTWVQAVRVWESGEALALGGAWARRWGRWGNMHGAWRQPPPLELVAGWLLEDLGAEGMASALAELCGARVIEDDGWWRVVGAAFSDDRGDSDSQSPLGVCPGLGATGDPLPDAD